MSDALCTIHGPFDDGDKGLIWCPKCLPPSAEGLRFMMNAEQIIDEPSEHPIGFVVSPLNRGWPKAVFASLEAAEEWAIAQGGDGWHIEQAELHA